ncbi:hypothetical protein EV182_005182 [Spiromyces aspiralis]|uniref:Uncharacterized protein n=1 Tax=Spiromyces aspiralis TaxID=68401 RepID=A0ACC1HNX5_9FUNG|nr:hypothetical protein EV182_005182 [Spiromyces aspiralis]
MNTVSIILGLICLAALVQAHFSLVMPKPRPGNMTNLAQANCGGSDFMSSPQPVSFINQITLANFSHGNGTLEYKFYPVYDLAHPVSLLNVTIQGKSNYTDMINFAPKGVALNAMGTLQAHFVSDDGQDNWYQCADVIVSPLVVSPLY